MSALPDSATPSGDRNREIGRPMAGANGLVLFDMHCHLDRMADGEGLARDAGRRGIGILCTTLTPADALKARERFSHHGNVRVATGLHPWWVADGDDEGGGPDRAAVAARQAALCDFVGEIGLDFSPAHRRTGDAQIRAFEKIVAACAAHPRRRRVLSIHAVRAAADALDILERSELPSHASCIFHWFSGTGDDFLRLRRLGCLISVGERMLSTKRGREYARQIDLDHLLLETDAPRRLDDPFPIEELEASLVRTIEAIAALRHIGKEELAARIAQTSSGILGMTR